MTEVKCDHRIYVWRLLAAVAFSGLSLSAGAANFGQFMAVVTGKSTAIKVASDGTALATKAPSALSAGGGWTGAGNYGVAAGASGATAIGVDATVAVGGAAVPITAIGAVAKDSVIGAVVGAATGGWPGAIIGAATPLAIAYLSTSGARVSPTVPGGLEIKSGDSVPSDGYDYGTSLTDNLTFPSRAAACDAAAGVARQVNAGNGALIESVGFSPDHCTARLTLPGGTVIDPWNFATLSQGTSACMAGMFWVAGVCTANGGGWVPATPQQVKDALSKNDPDPGIVPELDKAGVPAGALPVTGIKATGPATIAGPSTTTINNTDNSVTTRQVTNNYTYNGDTVTNAGTTIKNETTAADGTKTASTTTTVSPGDATPAKPDDPKVQCDKYPNSLGCAELDTPDADIPKDTKTVTFAAEDPFGSGQCPADVMARFGAIGGQTVKIVDWATFCGFALPLRGLVMALASIMAFFIIMPGGVRE